MRTHHIVWNNVRMKTRYDTKGPIQGRLGLVGVPPPHTSFLLRRESEIFECRYQGLLVGSVSCALVQHAACILGRHKGCDAQ